MTDLDCSNTNMYLKMTLLRAQQPTDQLVRKCQQKYLLQPLSNAAVTYRFVAVFLSPLSAVVFPYSALALLPFPHIFWQQLSPL